MVELVDCHAHLADSRIDAESVLAECGEAGVTHLLLNGTHPADWDRCIELAESHGYDCAIGVHPFFVQEWSADAEERLRKLLKSGRVSAVGEIGVDGTRQESIPLQASVFCRQLEIAAEYDMPVALHLRKGWQHLFSALNSLGISKLRGYCHNFTGSWETAQLLLKLGLHLSFNSPIFTARKVQPAIEKMPLERMLVESDTPDLPQPGKKESRPWHVGRLVARLAELRHLSIEEMASIIKQNYFTLFHNHP